jgi:putative ABC transport system substrate-binding protein
MKRREFIGLIGGASVWPLAALAQRDEVLRLVGVLMAVAENDPDNQDRIAAFRRGLADLGWKDGQNIHIEFRWAAGKIDLIQKYAKDLVALAPDVILANGTPTVVALQTATHSIPIVFALTNDPVGLGLVQSLGHPGGNITGFTFINPALIGKWIGLLGELGPGIITRAALLFNPGTTPFYRDFLPEIEAARQPGTATLLAMPVTGLAEMEQAIIGFAQTPGGALLIGPDPFMNVHIKEIAQLSGKRAYRRYRSTGTLLPKAV